jgi:uncharacterized protein (UPF0332 family)
MNFDKLVSSGLLKKQEISPEQINQMIKRASKDLETADYLLAVDPEAAYDYAYKAMMHVGRALIYSKGYRPSARQAHKTIVEFAKTALGSKFGSLTLKIDKMRQRSHLFTYEVPGITSEREAKRAIADRKKLVSVISERIRGKDPWAICRTIQSSRANVPEPTNQLNQSKLLWSRLD